MFLVLKQLARVQGSRRKAWRKHLSDVFLSRNFSLARASFNHSRLADWEHVAQVMCKKLSKT